MSTSFEDWEHDNEPNPMDDWECPCAMCMGIADAVHEEPQEESYFCGSNYCDDPACIANDPESDVVHPELL